MLFTSIGIRDAKIHLSKYLKMVQKGMEVIITDRGRPVGKIVPVHTSDLPLKDRIKRLEDQGVLEAISEKRLKTIPPPIPVSDGIAQKFLQQDRDNG